MLVHANRRLRCARLQSRLGPHPDPAYPVSAATHTSIIYLTLPRPTTQAPKHPMTAGRAAAPSQALKICRPCAVGWGAWEQVRQRSRETESNRESMRGGVGAGAGGRARGRRRGCDARFRGFLARGGPAEGCSRSRLAQEKKTVRRTVVLPGERGGAPGAAAVRACIGGSAGLGAGRGVARHGPQEGRARGARARVRWGLRAAAKRDAMFAAKREGGGATDGSVPRCACGVPTPRGRR
eukprot:358772-Chlamydomonas_euryale.AAC.26